ncbi:hypothetical protein [Spiroplasma endosymbiont of Lasioglossum malachurum]|uniref:hypothetical protein n=1 Tax=Spiroplasma endosymbiont of Lasioglossum malachurum TaxID=3066319 RepID=UPI0030D48D2A
MKKIIVGTFSPYSYGLTKPTFTYVTQDKFNEISNIIANDSKVKQWFAHINEWNSTLPQAINNSKTFNPQALYNWKRQEKEIIKGYIRDWSYISTLIEHELKLDELNKNIQGIKADFETLKKQVNELDNRLLNLENKSNLNCENTLTIVNGALNTIPIIGNVVGGITTMASGACAIGGV